MSVDGSVEISVEISVDISVDISVALINQEFSGKFLKFPRNFLKKSCHFL